MALKVNLRRLSGDSLRLEGELSVPELDIDTRDEVIQVASPLEYELEVEKLDGGLLLQGELRMMLQCKCVRCLKPFGYALDLEDWACHVPLQGEEAAPADDDGRIHFALGNLYRQQGRAEDATRALQIFQQRRQRRP